MGVDTKDENKMVDRGDNKEVLTRIKENRILLNPEEEVKLGERKRNINDLLEGTLERDRRRERKREKIIITLTKEDIKELMNEPGKEQLV